VFLHGRGVCFEYPARSGSWCGLGYTCPDRAESAAEQQWSVRDPPRPYGNDNGCCAGSPDAAVDDRWTYHLKHSGQSVFVLEALCLGRVLPLFGESCEQGLRLEYAQSYRPAPTAEPRLSVDLHDLSPWPGRSSPGTPAFCRWRISGVWQSSDRRPATSNRSEISCNGHRDWVGTDPS